MSANFLDTARTFITRCTNNSIPVGGIYLPSNCVFGNNYTALSLDPAWFVI